jgi:predicted dehydrogenase
MRPQDKRYRCAALSVVKHDYVPRGVAAHPRCELVVVADDANQPDWVHERNQKFADEFRVPYVRDVARAIGDHNVQVAVVSSQVERHCDLSIRAIERGLHVIQDKPMSSSLAECDRLLAAIERKPVKFLMWNRNFLPAVLHARELLAEGAIGEPYAIHVDFYFAKDAGPPKGTRPAGDPPMDWQKHQIAAHADGSDGGLAARPLGELEIEGIYPLAYVRMLTGAGVRRVFARTARHFHQLNVDNNIEDLGSLSLEMDGGLVGTLCIGRIGKASHPDIGEIKLHVLGKQGGLVISEARPEAAIYYRGQPPAEFRHRRLAVDNDYLQLDGFLRAIETGSDTILDARASRQICATVEAALESARSGQCVAVK